MVGAVEFQNLTVLIENQILRQIYCLGLHYQQIPTKNIQGRGIKEMSILNLLPLKLGFAYLHYSIMAPVEIVYFLAIVATTFNSLVMAGYNEYVDMLLVLAECRMNNTAAARVYAQRFPHRRHPSRREFPALVRRARQTGRLSAYPIRCQIYRPYRNEVNIINVLATVEAFPHKSIREIARDTGLSNTTIFRIMKDHNLRAYKMSFHQALQPSDWEKRLRFCHWAQRRLAHDPLHVVEYVGEHFRCENIIFKPRPEKY